MTHDTLGVRINMVADGNFGIFTALLAARQQFGDKILFDFLDKVPEKGEQLWIRFRSFQKERGDWMNFGHFIASVVMPIPKF